MKKNIFLLLLIFISGMLYPSGKDWYKNAVFYEIFVRAFYDTTGNGVGDINGVIEKLDYIESLGVDGIWLMPVFYSPSPHGYDTIDYYQINPVLGTEDDLVRLFNEAEKRNIKIVLDLVVNHTARHHEWFRKSELKEEPYTDFYVWKKEKPEGEWFSWTHSRRRDEWYYSSFGSSMPDLNFNNPLVREKIKEAAEYWLVKGAAGFRLDAAKHIIEVGPGKLQVDTQETVEWWSEFSEYVKSVKSDAVLIGEVWSPVEGVAKYYDGGKGLDLCFDFDLANAILRGAARGNTTSIIDNVNNKNEIGVPFEFYSPFISNHDTVRTMNVLSNNFNRARAAAVLLLTSPGTPFIYYGEEIGMYQNVSGKGDNAKRTIMQWSNGKYAGFTSGNILRHDISDNSNPYNVKFQDKRRDSLLNLYRKLIELRKNHPAMYSSQYQFIPNEERINAFVKTGENSSIIVIANQSDEVKNISLAAYNGEYSDLLTGRRFRINGNVRLKAGEILLLKSR